MGTLLDQLRETREGYEKERAWHRLLIDGYSGGGGFMGAAVQPAAGFWGSAAEVYSIGITGSASSQEVGRLTYLDRFPREDIPKFTRRVESAHYPNYIGPLTDLKLSFMMRKPLTVEGRPERIEAWRADIDGRGTSWSDVERDMTLRAASVGWIPVVIDLPEGPRDTRGDAIPITRAQSNTLGLLPTITPLFPANLPDYQIDDHGRFVWAKIRTDHVEQLSPFEKKVKLTKYTIWYPDRFEKYEVREGQGPVAAQIVDFGTHPFGEVPIAILRNKPSPDDPVKGIPMHGQETVEARALFNRQSELDEHMRGQVFAILVLAAQENEEIREIVAGTDNGIYLDPDSSQKHYFLSPDASVAGSYEKRLEVTIQGIYQQARVEFTRPNASRSAVSGIARKFEFAQTDRALADFATQLALFNIRVDTFVARGLGITDAAMANLRITSPATFDVEDLQSDMDIAISAIQQLTIGSTAEKMLRKRVINQLLPNLGDEDRKKIDEELESIVDDQANEQAMLERATFGEPIGVV